MHRLLPDLRPQRRQGGCCAGVATLRHALISRHSVSERRQGGGAGVITRKTGALTSRDIYNRQTKPRGDRPSIPDMYTIITVPEQSLVSIAAALGNRPSN